MTLEDVKLMDFNREMTDEEINNVIEDMLSLTDKLEFSKIFIYFIDNFYYTIDSSNPNPKDNPHIKKILKDDRMRFKIYEFYNNIDDLARFDR